MRRSWGLVMLCALILLGAAACGGGGGGGDSGESAPSFDDVRAIALELNGDCPDEEVVDVEADPGSVEKKAVQCTYQGGATITEQIVVYERFEDRDSLDKAVEDYIGFTQLPYVFVNEEANLLVRGPDSVTAVDQYDVQELANRLEEHCGCGEVRATGT